MLQRIDMRVIEDSDAKFDKHVLISASAGWSRGSCRGDSGGPLTLTENGKHVLIRMLSEGKEPRAGDYRGKSVFARVTHFLDWIDEYRMS